MAYAWEDSKEHGKYGKRIRGSFTPSGAGISSAAGATRGTGFTPSYVSTGVYRVTLDENFVQLVSANATYQGATADTSLVVLMIGDVNVTNRTVDIIVLIEAAGTLAKTNITASGILRRINFELIVADSDIPGSGAEA